jgi:hypothetical protein
MSRRRHSDENRASPGEAQLREAVDVLRHRATRRTLTLLECAIIRHAPFADCGRTIWELLPTSLCFDGEPYLSINGHRAIELLEQHADGALGDDELTLAEDYVRIWDYRTEFFNLDTPEGQRDELEVSFGVAFWLRELCGFHPKWCNIIDYYVANYAGQFYRHDGWRPLHHEHRTVALALIDDILGKPSQRLAFTPRWRTSTAVAIAQGAYDSREFSAMPILADALQDAGCENTDVLDHCRSGRLHVRGCWVVDQVLGNRK